MSKRNRFSSQIALPVLIATIFITLTGCDSKNSKKPVSQVAAKVNNEEISVHQINFILGRSNTAEITPEQAPQARREVLDKLIDQQLAVEQAVEKKLDHLPEVLMALDAGRREILARAYVGQLAAALAKPTPEEGKSYITGHPQLFADRRIFNIQEISLPASANLASELRLMLTSGKSMDEIAAWLKSRDIKFSAGSATRPAEQIPLDLLPTLHALKDGQGLVLETPQNITVMRLVASQSAPVSAAAALPRVQQFLGNQRINESISSHFKELKAAAKITYQGEFAENTETPAATIAAPPEPPPKSAKSNLEKGVAGIK